MFYAGPSLLDGAPIIGIITGLRSTKGLKSENPKTADLVQTWILRSDVAPHDALHSGEDASICGECPLRPYLAKGTGKPLCYATCSGGRAAIVNLWRSYRMGNIPQVSPEEAAGVLAGRKVRLGAYGDPAAIPFEVWETLLQGSGGSIGYTHQWRTCDARFAGLVMASVESVTLRDQAKHAGWRTFRVHEDDRKRSGEAVCPGSKEAGKKLTCSECMACNGTQDGRRGDIVIVAHGATAQKGPRR